MKWPWDRKPKSGVGLGVEEGLLQAAKPIAALVMEIAKDLAPCGHTTCVQTTRGRLLAILIHQIVAEFVANSPESAPLPDDAESAVEDLLKRCGGPQ